MSTQNNLSSPDLLPTRENQRDLSFWDFALLWAGMTINIAGFAIGAQLYPSLSPVNVLYAIFIGYVLVTALLVLNGDMGLMYGIPFTVYMRACFGYKGSHIPGIIRTIPCFFWFGFQTWVGALALDKIMLMFVGYSNLTLLILLFGAIQIFNAAYGLKAMAKFDWIAIPLLTIVFSGTLMWLLKSHNSTIGDILAAPSDNSYSFAFAVMGIAGGWITMALNSSDLTRKLKLNGEDMRSKSFIQRNFKPLVGQLMGLVIVGALVLMVGLTASILTGEWNPITVIIDAFENGHPVILVAAFLTIAFAQWSTNTAANLMPPTYIILNLFPKFSYARATIISGVVGLLIMPWKFSAYLVQFQVLSSSLLGPICGIMLADYYLVRKGKLNIRDMYREGGQYTYRNNYNPAALATLVLSFVGGLLLSDYAFFVTFGLSVVLYPVLMKSMVLNKYEQRIGEEILLKVE